MTPMFERVLAQAQALPPVERMRLASLLMQPEPERALTQAERKAAFDKICGKYAGVGPSVEQFLAWKQEEVEYEEARYERLFGKQAETAE